MATQFYSQNPAGQPAHQAAREAHAQGEKVSHEMRERANQLAAEQKDRAAQKVSRFGDALDSAAGKVAQENDQLASYIRRAADALHNAGSSLEHKDLDQIRSGLEDFARKRPQLFLGAAFASGVAMARFLKASPSRKHEPESDQPAATPAETTGYTPGSNPPVV